MARRGPFWRMKGTERAALRPRHFFTSVRSSCHRHHRGDHNQRGEKVTNREEVRERERTFSSPIHSSPFFPSFSSLRNTSATEDAEELVGDVPARGVLREVEDVIVAEGVALLVEVALAIDDNDDAAGQGGVAVNVLGLEGDLLEGEGLHAAHDGSGALHLLADPRHEGGVAVDAGELRAVGAEDGVVLVDKTLSDLVEGHG